MVRLNDNFENFADAYLFGEVTRRVSAFKKRHPDEEVIRMDVGDVSLPLCEAVLQHLRKGIEDLASAETFRGYGPEFGYRFLRERIADWDYRRKGIQIEADEVFVNDGCASDIGGLSDLFSADCTVAVQNPTYPAYVDTSLIAGRAGKPGADGYSRLEYLPCTHASGFAPRLPKRVADIIYLCSPNNPTGAALNRSQLQIWVDYARKHGSVIILDAAYSSFIRTSDVPESIYEVEGAREVAIELRSFSKRAGFTGLRCGYTIVPKALVRQFSDGQEASLNAMWLRRVCSKFNGASYPAQQAAMGVLTEEGERQTTADTNYYLENAAMLRDALRKSGCDATGGEDSPYVWAPTGGMSSWDFFDALLENARVSCTPGAGFGSCGEGYVRFTGFNTRQRTLKAAESIKNFLNTK